MSDAMRSTGFESGVSIARRAHLGRLAIALAWSLLGILWAAPRAHAGSTALDATMPGVEGSVLAQARLGDTLFVGGSFRSVLVPKSGGFLALDPASSRHASGWPRIDGHLNAITPDTRGGVFVGGWFHTIAGRAQTALARVGADGVVDGWGPECDGAIACFAVAGDTVFVGGSFSSIGGIPRAGLAAVLGGTGEVLPWNPGVADGDVTKMVLAGGALYVGGNFPRIAGVERAYAAAFDVATGRLLPWNPPVTRAVYALAADSASVYLSGAFVAQAGVPHTGVMSSDPVSGAPRWFADCGELVALARHGDRLYVANGLLPIAGTQARFLTALDPGTGQVLPWQPVSSLGAPNSQFDPIVTCILPSDSVVRVGGLFSSVNGVARGNLAAFDAASGALKEWAPAIDGPPSCLGIAGRTVLVGGSFGAGGAVARQNLAAIDLRTREVLGWNPQAAGFVDAIATRGALVYVGGRFSSAGGQARQNLACIDAASGLATGWNPGTDFAVRTILVADTTVFVGGDFTQAGGVPRSRLAALAVSDGAAMPWRVDAGGSVTCLLSRGDTLVVGGAFTSLGGRPLASLAMIQLPSAEVLPWDPAMSGPVQCAALHGDALYVGGGIRSAGGEPRHFAAAFELEHGTLLPWAPEPDASVRALVAAGGSVWAGGVFSEVSGRPLAHLVELDALTGVPAPEPAHAPDGDVFSLASDGSSLVAGGQFTTANGDSAASLARLFVRTAFEPLQVRSLRVPSLRVAVGDTVRFGWTVSGGVAGVRHSHVEYGRDGYFGPFRPVLSNLANLSEVAWVVPDAEPEYWWLRLRVDDESGAEATCTYGMAGTGVVASVGDPRAPQVPRLALESENPARGGARIAFSLPHAALARVALFDVQGREIERLFDGAAAAGEHHVSWNASRLSPGLYFTELRTPEATTRLRVIVLR